MLREVTVKNSKPKTKSYRIYDERGMYLEVSPAGHKYWRLKYRFAGVEKRLALGVYPETSLAQARDKRDEARQILKNGNDPGVIRQEAKIQANISSGMSFETVAREWFEKRKHEWTQDHADNVIHRLEVNIFPRLGHRPVSRITAPEVLTVLRVIESRGALHLAGRLKQTCGLIFKFAIATGKAENNPVSNLDRALKSPVVKHHAYVKESDLPKFYKRLVKSDADPQTKLAIRFLILTFVRTTELRAAEWSEFNFDKSEWRIPAERMKMKVQHIVPLSRQAIEVLRELQNHSGNRQHVFPNRHRPDTYMSENTILFALYGMQYKHRATGHGFRSTASTILNENGFAPDVIERQLAHSERNSVRAAYNYAQYLPERRKMMQWYADYLDEIEARPESDPD